MGFLIAFFTFLFGSVTLCQSVTLTVLHTYFNRFLVFLMAFLTFVVFGVLNCVIVLQTIDVTLLRYITLIPNIIVI
jgi:hypothetical protein